MKSKLLPLLIAAGTTAAPAFVFAQATATLYGTAHAQLESVSATGATTPGQNKSSRTRLSNVSSELGFKGSLQVWSGVTGLAQITTGVNVDNGGGSTNGGMWSSAKDTFVGLRLDNIGTLKLGRMSAAARWISGTADFSASAAGPQDDQTTISGASGLTGASPLFNVRMDNAVGFESAAWKGLSARVYYGANENKSGETVTTGAPLNDYSYSVGVQYVVGPVDLRAAYELRNDKGTLNNVVTNDTRDKNYRLGARYTLPTGTTLAAVYDRSSFLDRTATGTAKYYLKKTGWVMSARQAFDKHTVFAAYGQAGNATVTLANHAAFNASETGAKSYLVGYNFNFTPQLLLEAFVSRVANDTGAKYDFDSGSVGTATGANPMAIGAGLRFTF